MWRRPIRGYIIWETHFLNLIYIISLIYSLRILILFDRLLGAKLCWVSWMTEHLPISIVASEPLLPQRVSLHIVSPVVYSSAKKWMFPGLLLLRQNLDSCFPHILRVHSSHRHNPPSRGGYTHVMDAKSFNYLGA